MPGCYTRAGRARTLPEAGKRARIAGTPPPWERGQGRTCWRMRASSSPAASARRSPARKSARTWRAPGCRRQRSPGPAAGGAARVPRAPANARVAARACPRTTRGERAAQMSARGGTGEARAKAQEMRVSMARLCMLIMLQASTVNAALLDTLSHPAKSRRQQRKRGAAGGRRAGGRSVSWRGRRASGSGSDRR